MCDAQRWRRKEVPPLSKFVTVLDSYKPVAFHVEDTLLCLDDILFSKILAARRKFDA